MPDLPKSWRKTRRHLMAARDPLPSPMREDIETGNLDRLEDWLAHNELELALDELEGLGETNARSPRFWREPSHAAGNMGIWERSARYEAKRDQLP